MKLVQLMAADGWYAARGDVGFGKSDVVEATMEFEKLALWALDDEGQIHGLVIGIVLAHPDVGETTGLWPADEQEWFCGYVHNPPAGECAEVGLDVARDVLKMWRVDFEDAAAAERETQEASA